MKETYRWGIMGAGIIACKLADALRQNNRSELYFVGSKSRERAQFFAREMAVPRWGSYEELISDPLVDIIYVATTHNFHHANAKMALEAGKHLLVEKPFTVNAREADDLVKIASRKGLFLMEAIWTRFLPSWKSIRELLSEGAIGKVGFFDISFGKFVPPEFEKRLNDPALAGGATLDLGIYPLSFCCYMAREIPDKSTSLCRLSSSGVDELASYQLSFPSGPMAQIGTGYNLWMENRAVIYGSQGAVVFPDFVGGDRFTVRIHKGANEIVSEEAVIVQQHENGFIYQVEEVISSLDRGLTESPVIPLKESRDIMELMDRIRRQWGLSYENDRQD
jgi:dihydrodiol dehydrogenase / D-xylose 1-dehydrogenase (NADP)